MSHSLLCPHSEVSELIEISYPLEQCSTICISYISCNLLSTSFYTLGYFFLLYQFII